VATGSNILLTLYRQAFCRKRFYRLNRSLFHLGLRGMGVLNYESDHLSGERWLLEKFCRNRLKVAIDVGGNVGHYAELIVTRNDGVRLYSFEPHPRTFQALESSAARFGYVAMNLAVGAEVGYVDLFDHATNDGSEHASVFREVIEDVHHSTPTGHRLKMNTLDAFIDEKGIARVDLLQVDTEGCEFKLAGARKALREDPYRADPLLIST
jgi:FkbM family methyltransferase